MIDIPGTCKENYKPIVFRYVLNLSFWGFAILSSLVDAKLIKIMDVEILIPAVIFIQHISVIYVLVQLHAGLRRRKVGLSVCTS